MWSLEGWLSQACAACAVPTRIWVCNLRAVLRHIDIGMATTVSRSFSISLRWASLRFGLCPLPKVIIIVVVVLIIVSEAAVEA